MLEAGKVLSELDEWACQQGKKHSDYWVKIMRMEVEKRGYRKNITVLMDHHRDIFSRYYEVASGIRAA